MNREKHYRRLLALYPSDHRQQHGEEMLGVLLAADGGWRDSLNLVGGAVALHLRRVFNLDGGVRRQDVLAVVSLLGPVILLAGAANDLHEIAWWIKTGGLADMPFTQVPDAPAWAAWAVVAVLALFGQRRSAAVSAWLALALHVAIVSMLHINYANSYGNAGWILLGAFAAVSLTWSAGPVRGRELVGRRGLLLALGGVALTGFLLAVTPSLYPFGFWAYELGGLLTVLALALACYLACRPVPNRRTGRRAAFALALPVLTTVVEYVLVAVVGPPIFWVPAIETAAFYGLPALIVLSGFGIFRPIRRSLPS